MATLSEVLETAGCSRDDFNNWRRRDVLKTTFRETTPGVPLVLSKANALEVSFVAAFVRAGASPTSAAAYARPLLEHCRQGILRRWLIFPGGDLSSAKASDLPKIDELQRDFGATALTFICVEELVRKVDAIFDGVVQ